MEKLMKIFAWIPILNFVVIVIIIIDHIRKNNIKKMIFSCAIWIGVMFVAAMIRAVTTIALANKILMIVDIVTYLTLYISITLGALLFLKFR